MPKSNLDDIFKNVPNATKVADGYVIGDDECQFHVFGAHSPEDTEGLSHEEVFYLPFCTKEEILKIRKQKTSADYLLWLRAEAIADSPRAVRVFRKRASGRKNWSLTKYYDDKFQTHKAYVAAVGKKCKEKIKNLPAGMAFINDVNAMCIKSAHGNVVVVSEALSYFLYYMNIAFLGKSLGMEGRDTGAALSIALRVMLGSEALDFDLDPRGELPNDLDEVIRGYTDFQILFTYAHEYAHHTLGHLSQANTKSLSLGEIICANQSDKRVNVFQYAHRKEFDADLFAIKNVKNDNQLRNQLADSAFHMFIYFDILDFVLQYLALTPGYSRTHPKPLDRAYRLRKKLKDKIGAPMDVIEENIKYSNHIKKALAEDWLPYHVEDLERYGSHYLPSYKNKLLVDRVDF